MVKFKIREQRINNTNRTPDYKPFRSLRIKIFITFFIFLLIILVYDTYYEDSELEEIEPDNPELVSYNSKEYFKDFNEEPKFSLHNPSISVGSSGNYIMIFETISKNNASNIWISYSNDTQDWSKPKELFQKHTNITKPQIEFIENHFFAILFQINGSGYQSTSVDGKEWREPYKTDVFLNNDSIYYDNDHIIFIERDFLKIISYEKIKETGFKSNGQIILTQNFSEPTILKTDTLEYIIVHENLDNENRSIIITTIELELSNPDKNIIKLDLLILFIIIFIILIIMIVQEIARE